MCGRWSLVTDEQTLLSRFGAGLGSIKLKPRYNIAPRQDVPILRNDNPGNFSLANWGLVPHWAKDDMMAFNTINARAESIQDKPTYREPFKEHRCLIPADGFYEWKTTAQGKIPYRFVMKERDLFAFAGLYDTWNDGSRDIVTCTIITVEPNTVVKEVHPRMPAILDKKNESSWLTESSPSKLLSMLSPFPAEHMEGFRIGTGVNSINNEGPELIKPYVSAPGLGRFL